MNKNISKFKTEIFIISMLLALIMFHIITRSNITNYNFSKTFIPTLIKNINTSTFIILFVILICELGIIVSKIKGKIIKRFHIVLIQVIVIFFMFSFFVLEGYIFKRSVISTTCVISGSSMEPTLSNNETVNLKFTKKVNYKDIVIFKVDSRNLEVNESYSNNTYFIKRIIGLENDKVKWINKKLYINDELIYEDYIDPSLNDSMNFDGNFFYKKNGEIIYTTTIPKGYCFVLGDNRMITSNSNASLDSREIGLVPISSIIGIVNDGE